MAHFMTELSNSTMSSFGPPNFSSIERLAGEALSEELEEKINFSINHGDQVFRDVTPRIQEVKTSHIVDGQVITTTAPATTTTASLTGMGLFPLMAASSNGKLNKR